MPDAIRNFLERTPLTVLIPFILWSVGQTYWFATWKTGIDSQIEVLKATDEARRTHETRIIILEQAIPRIDASLSEIKAILSRDRASLKRGEP